MFFGICLLMLSLLPGQGDREWGCREFIVLTAPSSHSSPAPGWDRSPNLSQVDLPHVLHQVSPFHGAQPFGKRQLQPGPLRGSQILPESCSNPQNLDITPIHPQTLVLGSC